MKPKKPRAKRLALTVSGEIDQVLEQLRQRTNMPKSKIITGLLEETVPFMMDVVKAIDLSREGQKQVAVDMMANFINTGKAKIKQADLELEEFRNGVTNEGT